MNKKKSKALAFLLAASLLIPSVDGVVSAAELSKDNVTSVSKIEESQEVAPEQNNTNQEGTGENLDTQNPVTQNVAKIGDVMYTSLMGDEGAIAKAKDGEVIELLADVTEDLTVNKNITIDGKKAYKISGLTTLNKGTLKDLTIQPNLDNASGSVLSIGSGEQTDITMDGVTVNYSVTKRDGGSAKTVSGNKAKIVIQNCLFTNHPNNGGKTVDAPEWSYGLYVNGQADEGSILFTNNEFNGAFRTMLPGISGNMTISNNTFVNSVETVSNGPTSGAGSECTCITTAKRSANDNLTIINNTFDNAGAFLFQNIASVSGNTFKWEKFEHFIQLKGSVGKNLDLRNNTFDSGSNDLVVVDVNIAKVLLPTNQKAVSYYAWRDTEESIRPSDYSSYVYSYNEDGSKTFYPESEAALKAFTNPAIGNIGAEKNDKIVISKDMKIGDKTGLDIGKGQEITIIIPRGIKLELESNSGDKGAINVSGKLNISGDGSLVVGNNASLNTDKGSEVNMSDISLQNNGNLDLDGKVIFNNVDFSGNKPEGDGNIEYIYTPSKPIHPTYDHTSIIGSDRYETAGKIADKLGSYNTAVLVNATSTMSDGLSAAGLAGKEDAAILLVKKDSIPKATMDRLSKVKKVYIIGGENAISQKVVNQLKKNNVKVNVERLGGKTRVETSELVAKEIGNYKKAFVVNGFKGEADAMSASSVAAREEAPILLTNGKSSKEDRKSGVSYYVVGGKSVMNDSIVKKYKAERVAGDDRYETNREVINEFYGASETLYFANGETLVDALTASTIAKDDGLVLVGRKSDNKILNKKNTIQVGGMKFDVDFEK